VRQQRRDHLDGVVVGVGEPGLVMGEGLDALVLVVAARVAGVGTGLAAYP
jgi:hypothetical protein